MDKNKLANMFGINTHEADIEKLNYEKDTLACQVAHYKVQCEELEEQLAFYKLKDEDKVKYLMEDVEDIERVYKERIAEYEDLIKLEKANIDAAERQTHRAFAEGRMSAYSEMGIWNIEAHQRGNNLVMDKEGNIFELLLDIEDVKAEGEAIADEIMIDDLLCYS